MSREEAKRAKQEVVQANSRLESSRKEIEKAKTEARLASKRLQVTKTEADKAKQEAEWTASRLKASKTETLKARQEADLANSQLQAMKKESETAKAEARRARQRLEKVKNDFNAAKEAVKNSQSVLADYKADVAKANRRAESVSSNLQATKSEVTRARQDAEKARVALDKYRKLAENAKQEAESARTNMEAAELDVQRANKEAQSAQKTIAEYRAEAVTAKQEAEKSKAELRALRQEAHGVKVSAQKAKEDLAALQRQVANAKQNAANARDALNKLRKEVAFARDNAGKAKRALEDLKSETTAKSTQNQTEYREMRAKNEADNEKTKRWAEKRVATAENSLKLALKAENAAKDKLETAEQSLSKRVQNEKEAKKRVQRLEMELSQARGTISDQEQKINELAKQVAEQKALAAARVEASPSHENNIPAVSENTKATRKEPMTQEERRLARLEKMRGTTGSQKRAKKAATTAQATTKPQTTATQPAISSIEFDDADGEQRIIVKTSSPIEYNVASDANGSAAIAFKNAKLAPTLERTLDVTDFGGVVGSVSSYQDGKNVKLEVNVDQLAKSTVVRKKNELTFVFKSMNDTGATKGARAEPIGAQTRTIAREDAGTYAHPFERTAAVSAAGYGKSKKRYTGRRVDLDFKDADIHNILRLLSDVGHVNIITADDVKGTVTIRMRDVAWDHALDIILQAKQLGMVREGNLIRVAPQEVLEKEREMEIARRKQKIALEPLETRLIPVSYAKANELQPRAQDLLSERGKLSVDVRTNVIIATDTRDVLNQIESLIRNLDTQTPQVLIESRIVEATSTYTREIGIQWGGDFAASSATGNPTGLAFPNSIGVAGGATDGQTPMAGLTTTPTGQANPNFGVNMPAPVGTNSGGALGIALGSIANNANLSLRLSAMEETGTLRILSSPKILTLDNREAHIEQGTLIPYSQVSAQGVQTSFKEAKLNLTVTPHVTADGSILLEMQVMRDEPDFNNTGARGDPTILKREAETELLVSDGHTAVIGGIFTRNSGSSYKKVPFFADIPILGWLFKKKSDSDRRSEMLIFITPRIVNRAESIGS